MVRVKICGITNPQDASMAVELGVDALGFIFAPSPRRITPGRARQIISTIPPFVTTVGLFVDEDLSIIRDIMRFCGLDMIQLHGNESPEFCGELMPLAVKAFRLKDASSLISINRYQGQIRALLLDTYQQGVKGGTGKTFDWNLVINNVRQFKMPLILAGGLTPSNVQTAISVVKPYAIDVNSGVEDHPGKKSFILMKELMKAVQKINRGGTEND
jgi:phosphoribosylanthranilate isomerase